MNRQVLAVDIGGTHVRSALVAWDGHLLNRRRMETEAQQGAEAVVGRIIALLKATMTGIPRADLAGVGVAAPGPLDPWQGVIYEPPNLPGWDGLPLKEILEEELGLPVHVGNDANLAALGEHRYGAGRGVDHMVYLTVSTGIGGGIIAGGALFLGIHGLAGEVGHMTVEARGPRCKCGNVGCLEALASGPSIARSAARALRRGQSPGISALVAGDPARITAEVVVQAAEAGDATARQIVERAGLYLGIGVVNLLHLFDTQMVVIGGGVAIGAGELLLAPVRQTVERRAMAAFRRDLTIVPAALGDDAGLLGAAALVLFWQPG